MDRASANAREIVSFGPFRLHPVGRLLMREGSSVPLGGRAMDILIILTENAGKVVDRRELIARAWPNMVVEENNLRVHMVSLRKALEDGQAGTRYIANIPGRGYAFVAPVSRSSEPGPHKGTMVATVPADASRSVASPIHGVHGLPALPNRFVGREALTLSISRALENERLITLVGPGGIGKTTVAAAVARSQLASFADGVRFIDLGMLTGPGLVAGTLAAALGLTIRAADPIAVLLNFLQGRDMLLVLDCCEHVVDGIAHLAERIIGETLTVRILATSREPLHIIGEQVHHVGPLSCPPPRADLTAAEVLHYPAVQLFVARVTASRYDFALRDVDALTVAAICRRLEGLALAIEIVAGRVDAYGIQKVGELLNEQFELVWHGRRTAFPRHQTLGAAIDWSYDLLSNAEQIAFRRLAAFRGPFELDAAQHVVNDQHLDGPQTTEILATLVDKSLVAVESRANEIRYRLFDTTRGYLSAKLFESGESEVVLERHAQYWLQYLEKVDDDAPQRGSEGFAKCGTFVGSIRSALEWCFSEHGDSQLGSALAAVAAPLFLELSLVSECYQWTKQGLAALSDGARDGPQEMKLLAGLGLSAMVAYGNAEEVQTALRRGLRISERLGAAYPALRFLGPLHLSSSRMANFREALAAAERSTGLARQLGDPSVATMANSMLGAAHHMMGDFKISQRHCEAALSDAPAWQRMHRVYLGVDHRNRALCVSARNLWILGYVDQALDAANFTLEETGVSEHPVTMGIAFWTLPVLIWAGDWERAETMIERLLSRAEKFSLQPYRAMALGQQGDLAIRRGDPRRGVALLKDALCMAGDGYAMVTNGYLKDLAEGQIAMGHAAEALDTLDQLSDRINANGELLHLPELLRLRGEALAQNGSVDAEAQLAGALEAARRQKAAAWELRTAMSLCKLHQARGEPRKGADLLASVYACFQEGFETADLRAASDLLRSLDRPTTEPTDPLARLSLDSGQHRGRRNRCVVADTPAHPDRKSKIT